MRIRLFLSTLLALSLVPAAQIAAGDISPEAVREAIADGIRYLEKQQKPDGSFGQFSTHGAAGISGLCTLALLNAGVPSDDPAIQKALAYLQTDLPSNNSATQTYTTSLQTMVFAKADPDRFRPDITRNAAWLEQAQVQTGTYRGAWHYKSNPTTGDNSNSQFALLALHEAERVGVRVSDRTWLLAEQYWQRVQRDDGSFGYNANRHDGPRGSMTCAGTASLVIASGRIRQGNAQVQGDRILCCQSRESDSERIERALQWLGRNFSVSHNPGIRDGSRRYYYLYCLERVGRLTAHRFIGDHDWYREGTAALLAAKGSMAEYWKGVGGDEGDPRIATSMALLFLAKGRRPVLLAKLRHGPDEQWNQHENDVHNLTRYVESRWKVDLTWQVVDLRTATIDDLRQSPVLYFCGSESPLPPSDAEAEALGQKLRGYVERDGTLFVEAYGAGYDFDRGFRELVARMFPKSEYRLQLLPPDHFIWRTEEPVKPRYTRPIYGIDFGCRTSIVYCPPAQPGEFRPSLSCLWELSHAGRNTKYSQSVADQVQAGLSTGINVLAYATNRELKTKDWRAHLERTRGEDPVTRGRIRIANLRHLGGCEAAPLALANLMQVAAARLGMRTIAETDPISITDEAIFHYPVVFMHGRNRFTLTDAERKQLEIYVQRGGLLMANAICGSDAFTTSFRREMEVVFPDAALERIPPDHPLFTNQRGGFDLSTVTRRDPQRSEAGTRLEDVLREVPPDLDGIRFGDRYGVIFSHFDLSCALQKQNSLQCRGYTREDAARIGLNILLYALNQ